VAALVLVHSLLTAVFAVIGSAVAADGGGGGWGEIEARFLRTLGMDVSIVAVIILTILVARMILVGRSVTDFLILFVPPLRGPLRKLMLSRFSLSMYLMTGSAIGLPEAVRESGSATNNAYVEYQMEKAARKIEQGEPLTPSLEATGLFPPDFIDIVSVAEESGKVSESLKRVSIHYAEDADISLNRLISGIAWTIYAAVGLIMAIYIIRLYAGYIDQITRNLGAY